MNRALCLAAVALLCVLAAGCADRYEEAVQEQISHLREVNAILASLKKGASSEAARKKLVALRAKLKTSADRLRELEPPSKEKEEALKAKYEKEMRAVTNEMLSLLSSLANVEGGKEIGEMFKAAVPRKKK